MSQPSSGEQIIAFKCPMQFTENEDDVMHEWAQF